MKTLGVTWLLKLLSISALRYLAYYEILNKDTLNIYGILISNMFIYLLCVFKGFPVVEFGLTSLLIGPR